MSRPPRAVLRRLVQGVKCAIVGTLAFLAVIAAGTVQTTQTEGITAGQETVTSAPHQGRVDALIVRHECSRTGFGPDVIPGSAIVLRDNKVSHVSFDDGWAIYTGEATGDLIAVCKVAI